MNNDQPLFQPLTLGATTLPNRIVMAPLTRARATNRVPNDMMAEYYVQRASAGLIIAEATAISEEGYGWHGAPAIYTDAQTDGWKQVTERVHDAGGRIFLQLWHMGRLSHPDYLHGRTPVAPSAILPLGEAHTPTGKQPFVVPRALDTDDIQRIVEDYATATRRAQAAGFDGVEIHGANGYLIDEFLRDASNQRTDDYGGSIPNRARFLREVVEAVTASWSAAHTGVRLSPTMNGYGMQDSDPVALYTHVGQMLNRYDLAYVHTAEAIVPGLLYNPDVPRVTPSFRTAYQGKLIVNGGFDKASATQAVASGEADAVAFGQKFIANPDLPHRLEVDAELNPADMATFYSPGTKGYTDYPTLALA